MRHFDYYDIHSWNYDQRWDTARKLELNKPVIISDRINISVDGPAKIAGVGNGNPRSFEPFQAEFVDLFYGKAMIVIRSEDQMGEAIVTVTSKRMEGDTVKVLLE